MLSKSIKKTAIITTVIFALITPIIAFAWATEQSGHAVCNPQAAIDVTFSNKENDKNLAMEVTVKDNQTGNSVDLGTINTQESKSGEIKTGQNQLNNGTVTFFLTWANGKNGKDQRTASYSAVTCKAPTPTPTLTSTPSVTPTNSPAPTSTPSVTPTSTPTATVTPNPTQMPTETPSPTQVPVNNNNNNNSNQNSSNSSSSSDNSSNVNVTNTNNNTVTVEAAAEQQNTTVQQVPSAKELPKTGPADFVYSLFGLLPLGLQLRKFAKLG